MSGIGTLINVGAIVAGGTTGLLAGNVIKERYQETLNTACGVSILFLGIGGAMEKMLSISDGRLVSTQALMIVISMALGSLIGEILNIEAAFEKFGEWLKRKTGNAKERLFVDGFVTASLTVSIGAMAIVGAIQDGISGDWSILAAKSVLDFVIILVMTCSLGKGCMFSAIPVFIFEGSMTACAALIRPFITVQVQDYLSLVGSILIFCIGLNLVWDMKIRVSNMLPAILIAVIAAVI